MKKFGLLKYSTSSNVGDEIQSIAARQMLPHVDAYVDRDNMDLSAGEGTLHVIMNGWFMHPGRNRKYAWPPPENIKPLFVSLHAGRAEVIGNPLLREYYKQYEPVGCRDLATLRIFEEMGVEAYFSGCLTLTLTNPGKQRTDNVVFSDPFGHINEYHFPMPGGQGFDEELWSAVPEDVRKNAKFVTHAISKDTPTKERFARAEYMLELFGSAKLVVTSRLHCVLPCLAFGTPVLYLGYRNVIGDRFGGLVNLMNFSDTDRIRSVGFEIDFHNPPPPPDPEKIQKLSKQLKSRCEDFVSG